LSAAHTETATRRQIRSVERRGLRVERRDDEAERFFMGYYFGGVKASNTHYGRQARSGRTKEFKVRGCGFRVKSLPLNLQL
jgi:hypothetical protein